MQTRELPDFGGLYKNTNCAFPLMHFKLRAIKTKVQTTSFYFILSYFKKEMVWNYGTSQLASLSALFMKKNISIAIFY